MYAHIPDISQYYAITKLNKGAHHIFYEVKLNNGSIILNENEYSDTIYILKSGNVAFFKKIQYEDSMGYKYKTNQKILDLLDGELFGTDKMIFDIPNKFGAKVTSNECTLLAVKLDNFMREYKRVIPSLTSLYKQRYKFMNERMRKI